MWLDRNRPIIGMTAISLLLVAAFFVIAGHGSYTQTHPLLSHHNRGPFRLKPSTNNGKRWRIGYFEGGAYMSYAVSLHLTAQGLETLGWIEGYDFQLPDKDQNSVEVWNYLCTRIKSKYLEFVPDAYYSGDWNDKQTTTIRKSCLQRLNKKNDIDFMIAAGTIGGLSLANNEHSVPTMTISASDPVASGLVLSAYDSGLDHFTAKCDPTRYQRQARAFYNLCEFKSVGVVYENEAHGKVYANVQELEKVGEEFGFRVVARSMNTMGLSEGEKRTEALRAIHAMLPEIDAFWIPAAQAFEDNDLEIVLEPLIKAGIPTWSQNGPTSVQHGALFSIAGYYEPALGKYYASVMVSALNGVKVRDIGMVFETPKSISINLNTARRIGYTVPPGLLAAADVLYDEKTIVKTLPAP